MQNWTKSFLKPFRSLHWPITLRIHAQRIQSNLCKIVLLVFYWRSSDVLLMQFLCIINVNLSNNGMLYFGLIDAKIRASDIDLPVKPFIHTTTMNFRKTQTVIGSSQQYYSILVLVWLFKFGHLLLSFNYFTKENLTTNPAKKHILSWPILSLLLLFY